MIFSKPSKWRRGTLAIFERVGLIFSMKFPITFWPRKRDVFQNSTKHLPNLLKKRWLTEIFTLCFIFTQFTPTKKKWVSDYLTFLQQRIVSMPLWCIMMACPSWFFFFWLTLQTRKRWILPVLVTNIFIQPSISQTILFAHNITINIQRHTYKIHLTPKCAKNEANMAFEIFVGFTEEVENYKPPLFKPIHFLLFLGQIP